jgi:hypothetical protein
VSQTILRDLMSSHGSGTLQPLAVGWGPRAPGRQRRWSDLWSTSFLSGLGSLADLVCLPGSPLMTGPNLGDAFQVGDLTALLDRDFSGGGLAVRIAIPRRHGDATMESYHITFWVTFWGLCTNGNVTSHHVTNSSLLWSNK